MSIRNQIAKYGEASKKPGKVDLWLSAADFDVEEFKTVAADPSVPISWIALWAKDNGFESSETTLRKWVQECRSETK